MHVIHLDFQELTVLICAGGKSLLLGLQLSSWTARIRAHVLNLQLEVFERVHEEHLRLCPGPMHARSNSSAC